MLIRFVAQSCTHLWKGFASILYLVLHACKTPYVDFFPSPAKPYHRLSRMRSTFNLVLFICFFSHRPAVFFSHTKSKSATWHMTADNIFLWQRKKHQPPTNWSNILSNKVLPLFHNTCRFFSRYNSFAMHLDIYLWLIHSKREMNLEKPNKYYETEGVSTKLTTDGRPGPGSWGAVVCRWQEQEPLPAT
jgi:hypothetical protein